MPIWGDVFSKSQTNTSPEDVKNGIDALVKYLETIQDKGEYRSDGCARLIIRGDESERERTL